MNQDLWNKLETICKETDTSFSGIKHLVNYYKSMNWTEEEALSYTIELFENGTIEQIMFFGKDGEQL